MSSLCEMQWKHLNELLFSDSRGYASVIRTLIYLASFRQSLGQHPFPVFSGRPASDISQILLSDNTIECSYFIQKYLLKVLRFGINSSYCRSLFHVICTLKCIIDFNVYMLHCKNSSKSVGLAFCTFMILKYLGYIKRVQIRQ